MKIKVLSATPLKGETTALLARLHDVVGKIITIGQYRMGFVEAKIVSGVLYWKKSVDGYLAINPSIRKMYDTDNNLKPLGTNFSIDLDDISVLVEVFEECLENAQTGVFGPLPRLQRSINSSFNSLRNLFPGTKHYQGYPLTEKNIMLDRSFIFTARRVIEAGEKVMNLVNSKIVDGHLFLYQGKNQGYLVIFPDGKKNGSAEILRSQTLNIADCTASSISRFSDVKKLRSEFLRWLSEAGL